MPSAATHARPDVGRLEPAKADSGNERIDAVLIAPAARPSVRRCFPLDVLAFLRLANLRPSMDAVPTAIAAASRRRDEGTRRLVFHLP